MCIYFCSPTFVVCLLVFSGTGRRNSLTRKTAHTCVPTNWSLSNSSGGACKIKWRTSFKRFVCSLIPGINQFIVVWLFGHPGNPPVECCSNIALPGLYCKCVSQIIWCPVHANTSYCVSPWRLEVVVEKYCSLLWCIYELHQPLVDKRSTAGWKSLVSMIQILLSDAL